MTLIGTAYNLAPIGAWFPPFIETAIAASIFYMAIEGNPPMSRFAVDSPVVWGNPPHASLPLAIPAGTDSVGGNRVRIGFGQNRGKRDRLRGDRGFESVRSAVCATTAYISMRPDGILQ